jgi:CheY-like chemotaxis protein
LEALPEWTVNTRILLAEDNAIERTALTEMLRGRSGYEITETEDGQAAGDLLRGGFRMNHSLTLAATLRTGRGGHGGPPQMAPAICSGTRRAKPDRFLLHDHAEGGREFRARERFPQYVLCSDQSRGLENQFAVSDSAP